MGYSPEYYQKNKEIIRQKHKDYYIENRDVIRVSQKDNMKNRTRDPTINYYVECPCGKRIKKFCVYTHNKSEYHKKNMPV